ncbi:hypothetical protein pb186bvf_009072 [Paramecium bursaria]
MYLFYQIFSNSKSILKTNKYLVLVKKKALKLSQQLMSLDQMDNKLDQLNNNQDELIQILQNIIKIFKYGQEELDQAMQFFDDHKNVALKTSSGQQCGLCGKHCSDKQVLNTHYQYVHKVKVLDFGPNLYSCSKCNNKFKDQQTCTFMREMLNMELKKRLSVLTIKRQQNEQQQNQKYLLYKKNLLSQSQYKFA